MSLTEQFWNTVIETNAASGHLHQHVEGENWGMASIVDDNGKQGIWTFNKKTGEITLKGA